MNSVGRNLEIESEFKCQCKVTDAWRCARDQNLHDRISCDCDCHRYILSVREVEEQAKKELQSVFAFAPKVLVKEKKYLRRIRPEIL